MEDFYQFLYKLSTLNVAKDPKIGKAPHKPILLLTVFQMIRQSKIWNARLKLEPSLISEFKLNWDLLVTSQHSANIVLPMFHMRSEGFWKLQTKAGYEKAVKVTRSVKAIKTFQEIFDCVLIDSQVFEMLLDPKLNAKAQDYLLWCYFSNTAHLYSKAQSPAGYLDSKEQVRMVAENSENYSTSTSIHKLQVPANDFQVFVPIVYNSTCAIAGIRTKFNQFQTLVDACHIVPFAVSQNDRISNGVALSPSIHKAFELGLVSVEPNSLQVVVSESLLESPPDSIHSLLNLRGRKLCLPADTKLHPDPHNLAWHYNHVYQR